MVTHYCRVGMEDGPISQRLPISNRLGGHRTEWWTSVGVREIETSTMSAEEIALNPHALEWPFLGWLYKVKATISIPIEKHHDKRAP